MHEGIAIGMTDDGKVESTIALYVRATTGRTT